MNRNGTYDVLFLLTRVLFNLMWHFQSSADVL
jgi:hypothetical protein